MGSSIASLAQAPARQVLKYAEKVAAGIPEEIFSKKPVSDGRVIDTNHPAFVFGHLSLYPNRICGLVKWNIPAVVPPPAYPALFLAGSECKDDPEGRIYPGKAELTEFFFSGMELILEKLPQITDDVMLAASTDEKSRERFPILGSFIIYLLTAHPNLHLGQISTWRRCMGLAPL